MSDDPTVAALRVLLSVQETNEMAAMKEQSMRFKTLYPHLFLTNADVGSAAFSVTVCVDDTIMPRTCAAQARNTKTHNKLPPRSPHRNDETYNELPPSLISSHRRARSKSYTSKTRGQPCPSLLCDSALTQPG